MHRAHRQIYGIHPATFESGASVLRSPLSKLAILSIKTLRHRGPGIDGRDAFLQHRGNQTGHSGIIHLGLRIRITPTETHNYVLPRRSLTRC